jgi:hypothetical protein
MRPAGTGLGASRHDLDAIAAGEAEFLPVEIKQEFQTVIQGGH